MMFRRSGGYGLEGPTRMPVSEMPHLLGLYERVILPTEIFPLTGSLPAHEVLP